MSSETVTNPPQTMATISGYVHSTSGLKLKGAKVTWNTLETRTLADGFFVLNDLLPGKYEVTASLQGFKSTSKVLHLREGAAVKADFTLSKATGTAKICGYVYESESKKPVKLGGTVVLVLPIANKYKDIDKKGYYEFENLPAGTYEIVTSIPGYADENAVLMVANREVKTYNFLCKLQNVEEPPWG